MSEEAAPGIVGGSFKACQAAIGASLAETQRLDILLVASPVTLDRLHNFSPPLANIKVCRSPSHLTVEEKTSSHQRCKISLL